MEKEMEVKIKAIAVFDNLIKIISYIPRELTEQEARVLEDARKVKAKFMKDIKKASMYYD